MLPRTCRVASRRFSSAAAPVTSWKDLVSPWTPPEFVQRMKVQESKINGMRAELGADTTVPSIDWAHWKNTIKTPGVVDELQKAYTSHKFDDMSIADMEAEFKAHRDEAQAARKKAVWATRELERAEYCKGIANKVATEMHNWNQWQWMDAIPGMENQIIEQFKNEDYAPSERSEQLKSFDFELLAKQWNKGVPMDGPAPPERVGDVYPEEEMKLQDQGVWSIKRLYLFKEERDKLQAQLVNEKKELDAQFPIGK